jgi:hypothetical protein
VSASVTDATAPKLPAPDGIEDGGHVGDSGTSGFGDQKDKQSFTANHRTEICLKTVV